MLAVCLSLLEDESDRVLMARIYEKYERRLYAVALGILHSPSLAEDAVGDAFVSMARHFPQTKKFFQHSRNEMDGWCVIIVKHAALSILRKEGRFSPLEAEAEKALPAREDPEAGAGFAHLVELVRALPEHYREVLELHLLLELSPREIARRLGLTSNTVRQRIFRGKQLLREQLREEGYPYG